MEHGPTTRKRRGSASARIFFIVSRPARTTRRAASESGSSSCSASGETSRTWLVTLRSSTWGVRNTPLLYCELLLRGGDRGELRLRELLAALEAPAADPLLHRVEPRGALGGVVAEEVVHVARLAILGVLAVVEPPHQRTRVRAFNQNHDVLVGVQLRALHLLLPALLVLAELGERGRAADVAGGAALGDDLLDRVLVRHGLCAGGAGKRGEGARRDKQVQRNSHIRSLRTDWRNFLTN